MSNVSEEGLDAEGKAVLDELEKEGFEVAGREKPADVTPEPVTPTVETTKPEEKTKTDVTPEPDKKEVVPMPERKVQHVPLPKYLETEKLLKEANAKIEELSKGRITREMLRPDIFARG